MKSPSPEHWSKDFVEHLRTVHFTLVSVSAGLLLLLSSRPYDAKLAATQLTDILQINKALSHDLASISPGRVYSLSDPDAPDWSQIALPNSDSMMSEMIPMESPDGMNPSEWLKGIDSSRLSKAIVKRTFHLSPSLFKCLPFAKSGYYVPIGTHATLRDFREWWDTSLQQGEIVDSAIAIGRVVRMAGPSTLEHPDGAPRSLALTFADASSSDTVTTLGLSGYCDRANPQKELDLRGSDQEDHTFTIHIQELRRVFLTQQLLHERFDALKPGAFDKSISDLAKAARGREEEDFATLTSQIYAEASKGDETFDAFGIKCPSDQVTRWGIIALIGVQSYLFMYLKRLRGKLKPDDPGWDMPWMAMDQSLLARVMLFFSVLVLPVCAALFVLVQAASQLVADGSSFHLLRMLTNTGLWNNVQLFLMLLGFCLSVTLSILSWKYRPKLSEPSAPAQLFE